MKESLIPFFGIVAALLVVGFLIRSGGPVVHFLMALAIVIAIVYRFVAARRVV